MSLKARALLNVLKLVKDDIQGHRVDTDVDDQVLIKSWKKSRNAFEGNKHGYKRAVSVCFGPRFGLNLTYFESKSNPADAPS